MTASVPRYGYPLYTAAILSGEVQITEPRTQNSGVPKASGVSGAGFCVLEHLVEPDANSEYTALLRVVKANPDGSVTAGATYEILNAHWAATSIWWIDDTTFVHIGRGVSGVSARLIGVGPSLDLGVIGLYTDPATADWDWTVNSFRSEVLLTHPGATPSDAYSITQIPVTLLGFGAPVTSSVAMVANTFEPHSHYRPVPLDSTRYLFTSTTHDSTDPSHRSVAYDASTGAFAANSAFNSFDDLIPAHDLTQTPGLMLQVPDSRMTENAPGASYTALLHQVAADGTATTVGSFSAAEFDAKLHRLGYQADFVAGTGLQIDFNTRDLVWGRDGKVNWLCRVYEENFTAYTSLMLICFDIFGAKDFRPFRFPDTVDPGLETGPLHIGQAPTGNLLVLHFPYSPPQT